MTQESLGFSPADPVFAHTPRGPLATLKDQFLSDSPAKDILSYVSDFRSRLHRAHGLARENVERAQGRMKAWYVRKAVVCHFKVGDQVLVLLPILGSALQARYAGPYEIKYKVSDRDYMIATPDRRQQRRLCQVNMLKPYFEQGSTSGRVDSSLAVLDPSLSTDVVVLLFALVEGNDEVESSPSHTVIEGRLNNKEMLSVLVDHLPHLYISERADDSG